MIRRQLVTGLLMTLALTVLLGLIYPFAVTAVAQVAFRDDANGSLVKDSAGRVVGSSLLGQRFDDANGNPLPQYFQPRPSAAGAGYDPKASGASNLGPSNQTLLETVAQRVADYRAFNAVDVTALVPVDAVTSSGSGLDPGISVANARLQAARVAKARGLPVDAVLRLIDADTEHRQWGVLGEDWVNVLDLNLALDAGS
jgi:K+-transporting ATPase ATPase C chain